MLRCCHPSKTEKDVWRSDPRILLLLVTILALLAFLVPAATAVVIHQTDSVSRIVDQPGLHTVLDVNMSTVEITKKNVMLSVSSSQSEISQDSSASITVQVVDSEYNPVQDVFLMLDGGGGVLDPSSGYTDSEGNFYTTFTATNPGKYLVVVSDFTPPTGYAKFGCPCGGTYITVTGEPLVSNKVMLSVSANPIEISQDSSASITVQVVDSDSNPVPEVYIVLNGGGGILDPSSGYTDAEGNFFSTFSATSSGKYLVVVSDFTPPSGYEKFKCPCGGAYVTVKAPDPKAVSIKILANPSQVEEDLLTSIIVTVTDPDGKPVENADIMLDGGGGTLNPLSGSTDSMGQFSTDFKTATAGKYTVQIIDIKLPTGYEKPSSPYGSTSITVLDPDSPHPPGSQTQTTYQPPQYTTEQTKPGGNVVAVQNYPPIPFFSVFPASGQAPLNVSYDGSGSRDIDGYVKSWNWDFGDGATGSGRTVTHLYQNAGTFTVTLLVKDNFAVSNSSSQQVVASSPPVTPTKAETVPLPPTTTSAPMPDPLNWLPIAAMIAGILIIAGGSGYMAWVHENLNLQPQKKSVPCDGTSTIPIQVQFNNPFGRLRRQKKNREIELSTTSGTIQNVIIPAGREFVEAILTASTEGGLVTVTGKSDKKIVEVQVKFECIEKELEVEVTPSEIPADGASTATVYVKIKNDKGRYVTSLSPRTIELKSSLGTISPLMTIAPKTLSGTATLTAGKTVGTARITASMGPLTGAGEVSLTDLAKRFCMHCGATMTMDAPKCPKCGNTPPSGVDTKSCSTCGAVLPVNAKFCDMCGARQPQ